MSDDTKLDINDGVAVITFNRPDAMNTFTTDMMDGLGDAYRRCDEDDAVRAVVVTGSGKAFCARAELQASGDTFNSGGCSPSEELGHQRGLCFGFYGRKVQA